MTLISRLVFFKNKKKTPTKSSDRIKINDISIIVPVKDNQKGVDNYLDNFFATVAGLFANGAISGVKITAS